tara:strand:+ start:408 stop:2015 length:1608 start_codon:yes stop_codon:yes gene_type:complete
MAINSTNFKFNTPDNGTEEDTWGVKLNENWDKIDALLQGTSYTDTDSNTVEKIRPDLLGGSWAIDNTAVTSSAAELNKLDGVTASTAELNYIVGATSSLQTQLNGKQAVDAGLTSISGLTTAANNMIYTTGSDTYAATSLTAAGRALLDDADAAAQRTTLGLGSAATTASTAYATSTQGSTADTALQPSDNISVLTNNSGYITGNQTITLSGDVSGSGTTAITTNIGANKVGVNELNLSEGTSGQFLKTDGSGTISFADAPTQATSFTNDELKLTYVNNGTAGPTLKLYHQTTSLSGSGDVAATIEFNETHGTAGNEEVYGAIRVSPLTGFGTASDGKMRLSVSANAANANLSTRYLEINGDADTLTVKNMNIVLDSGNGIDFSATADGSGTDTSELFDDYEEGTWTPTLIGSGGAFAALSLTVTSCKYTKVGRLVTLMGFFNTSNVSVGTASGAIQVGGLPYVPSVDRFGASCYGQTFAGETPTMVSVDNFSPGYLGFQYLASATADPAFLQVADLTTGSSTSNLFRFTVTYEV